MRKIQPIDGIKHYWLKDDQSNRKLTKRFQKTELFAARGNFVMWLYISLWYIIYVKQKYNIHNRNVIDEINDFLGQNETFPCFWWVLATFYSQILKKSNFCTKYLLHESLFTAIDFDTFVCFWASLFHLFQQLKKHTQKKTD